MGNLEEEILALKKERDELAHIGHSHEGTMANLRAELHAHREWGQSGPTRLLVEIQKCDKLRAERDELERVHVEVRKRDAETLAKLRAELAGKSADNIKAYAEISVLHAENEELRESAQREVSRVQEILAQRTDEMSGQLTAAREEIATLKEKLEEADFGEAAQEFCRQRDAARKEIALKTERLEHFQDLLYERLTAALAEVERLKCENANLTLDLEWPLVKERDQALARVEKLETALKRMIAPGSQQRSCNICDAVEIAEAALGKK